jgi:predicted NUDIX family phosphoesterase
MTDKQALCIENFYESVLGLHVPDETQIIPLVGTLKDAFFSDIKTKLVSRSVCENIVDGSLVQVIPYIVIRKGRVVLSYSRGKLSGDKRLRGKRSVGLGGHVDYDIEVSASETDNVVLDYEPFLLSEAVRELNEELGVDVEDLYQYRYGLNYYLIYTSPEDLLADHVSKAHLGFVIDIDLSLVKINEIRYLFDTTKIKTVEQEVVEDLYVDNIHYLLEDHKNQEIIIEPWSLKVLSLFI